MTDDKAGMTDDEFEAALKRFEWVEQQQAEREAEQAARDAAPERVLARDLAAARSHWLTVSILPDKDA